MKHSTFWGYLRVMVAISLLILPSASTVFAAAEFAPLAQASSTITLPNASSDPGQSGSFTISLDNPVEVASGQIRFTFDATIGLQVTSVQTAARTPGYSVATSNVANPNPALRELQVLFYTLTPGTSIVTGTGAILTVNYTTALTATGSTALNFTQTLLASPAATSLPVTGVNGSFTINAPATNTPTNTAVPPTATNTAVPPTATNTNTSVPPTATNTAVPPTATNTAVPPTATNTNTPVPPTATNTAVPPTATNTNTPIPPTATNTAVPPTATNTNTPVPPTATNTAVPPTATNTNTPIPPTATNTAVPPTATRTNTPVAPTATNTPVPPTATNTAVAPTATSTKTNTPVAPTATSTKTNTPIAPTATSTKTNTPVAPTATSTKTSTPIAPTATATKTNTPVAPTATSTKTNTPVAPTATSTKTNTPVAPTATSTKTNTPVAPTATSTKTKTPVAPTATATKTNTPVAPTATSTKTKTPVAPTATATKTSTPVVPTATSTKTSTPVPPTATKTNTPVPPTATPTTGPTPGKANITFIKRSEPKSIQDFTFYGAFGMFLLDDPAVDDGDAALNSITYSNVSPGTYSFSEAHQASWELSAITCTPSTRATVDMANRSVTLQVQAGDNIVCTFVNERLVNIDVHKFNDVNGDGVKQSSEPYLSGWEIGIYSSSNQLLFHAVTDANGLYSKTNLRPGTYKVCETPQSGWTNTLPGTVDSALSRPCYTITLNPGQNASVNFGNRSTAVSNQTQSVTAKAQGVTISNLPDINEAPTYDPALSRRVLFLPVVSK